MRASPEKWHLSKDVQEVREGLWKSIPGREDTERAPESACSVGGTMEVRDD